MEEEHHATVAVGNPSHRFDRPLIRRSSDSISNLPDEILHHILSFIPETNLVIRTSVLSKRWRHVWSKTPHLSFEWLMVFPKLINKTLASYTASKITSFHLCTSYSHEAGHVHSSIEFAMSHNVDNLSLAFSSFPPYNKFPDFFYTSSSLKRVELRSASLTPSCIVSWTSLRDLSLTRCKLSDISFLKILSGCPILESLSLNICESLKYLDLTKSLRLTRLEIERRSCFREPMQSMQIVAPHIHYLRLRDSEAHCTFLWDCVNSYLKKQRWRLKDEIFPTSQEYEVVKPKVMASFMELLLANTNTLETLVVQLGSCIARSRFKELFQIALTLSHDKKVSVMLKRSNG
ncbi:hypothetical protein AXX17_AT5G02100 [Arabidopsis thaliana]|uniref:F-box domain-containing protein n=1 Tax=Arabidopsis thaliana TaxID=3702 RepID=A0A178UGS6_ARATH|nr:hypothetical protein AXX17_AT5G02100 [Arabidopsis thaliana]